MDWAGLKTRLSFYYAAIDFRTAHRMPWRMAEKALGDLRNYLYEAHAHTGQLTQAVISANSRKGPPPLPELMLPFARPAGESAAAPVTRAAARDFLSSSRRGRVPGWAVALTSQENLLQRIRAAAD